ncbi:hypothetical protein CBP33_08620 [Acidovorax carolinensis]|nr:hypothetical protein CBP33_08620 [Acidovorax carolinensis]
MRGAQKRGYLKNQTAHMSAGKLEINYGIVPIRPNTPIFAGMPAFTTHILPIKTKSISMMGDDSNNIFIPNQLMIPDAYGRVTIRQYSVRRSKLAIKALQAKLNIRTLLPIRLHNNKEFFSAFGNITVKIPAI